MRDGWRANARIHLHHEKARFGLSALGLDLWSDDRPGAGGGLEAAQRHFTERFGAFVKSRAEAAWRLRRHATHVDLVPATPPAVAITFERLGDRIELPRHPPHDAVVQVCCRLHDDGLAVDLWFRFNHAPVDGAPMQEMVDALKAKWGVLRPPQFPSGVQDTRVPAGRDACTGAAFLDFAPVLSRKRRVGALLMWHLSRHAAFEGRRFSMAVDVPPVYNLPRSVGLLSIRPGDYGTFDDFATAFERLLEAVRARADPITRLLNQLAPLPPTLRLLLERLKPDSASRIIGTVGISILSRAEVFMAPYDDFYRDGFMAFGSFRLPAAAGGTVGAVTAKGTPQRVDACLGAMLEILERNLS